MLDFAALVTAKLTNDAVSARFLLFCLVGLTGIAIHLTTLFAISAMTAVRFGTAQTIATVVATTWNFVLNNFFTYRAQRLAGWRFLTGLVRFQLICAIGRYRMSVSQPGSTITTAAGGSPASAAR